MIRRNTKITHHFQKLSCFQKKYPDSRIPSLPTPINPSNFTKREIPNETPFRDVYLRTKMISSYVNDLRLGDALQLFDETPLRDTVMWNLMIKGCLTCGSFKLAQKLFDEMPHKNVVSWTTMIDAFLKRGMIEEANALFAEMPVRDTAAWNAMIHGLFTNGRVEEASKLFDEMPERNVISWTTMISGLDQLGRSDKALSVFTKMVRVEMKPTSTTFCSVLSSCGKVGDLLLGSQIHALVAKIGYVFDTYVIASLMNLYANCEKIEECVKAFNEKLHINVVVWTSLLTGYGVNNEHEEALRVFINMMKLGVIPNQSSLTSALNSSREIETHELGKGIHCLSIKMGLQNDVYVGNSLTVLYSKCGNIQDGIISFKEVITKNTVSWNAIIVGCAQHGRGEWAIAFFAQMAKAGLKPDEITFTGLLNSCSHSGLLLKGRHFFESLRKHTTIEMKLEHFSCMVDILCRSGKLLEAEELVNNMPMQPNKSIWLALLSGSRAKFDVETGERAAKKIFEVDPHCGAAYVLLSNIYAFSGRWADVARVRMDMKRVGTVKQPGRSWVVGKGLRHSFVSSDKSHPMNDKIYEKLGWLREDGSESDGRLGLHDVE